MVQMPGSNAPGSNAQMPGSSAPGAEGGTQAMHAYYDQAD